MRTLRFLGPLLAAALLLAACGGGAAEAPTAAPPAVQPTTVAAQPTVAPPTPTFEQVTDVEPTVGAASPLPATATQASGALAWRDRVLRNDEVIVNVTGLTPPDAGQVYAAWLSGKDNSLPLGALSIGAAGATLSYVSPTNDNLLGLFERIYVTKGPQADATTKAGDVVLTGALPEKALVHIRHVLVSIGNTPGKLGFALGLRQETDEVLRHAQFLNDALNAGDFRLVKLHAEHIHNIIAGADSSDLNGDGKVQNPGDGFGLLPNGQQDGYLKGMIDHAKLASEAPDATEAIKLHAGHVQIAGENTRLRVQDILDRAIKITKAGGITDTQQDVLAILALAQQTIQGVDTNLDEQVGPVPGEGGVLTAYQHAQLMSAIPLAAGVAPPPAQAQAAPAAQPIAIEITDNRFGPNKITVPVGATVVWTHKGQRPHTVTADDGSFDSGKIDGGGTFEQTFDKPGTYPYYCTFHGGKGGEGMAGAIIVAQESAAAAAPPPVPAVAAPPAPAPATAGAASVAIGDNTFTPKEISIPVGGTVVWTHSGQRPHTVTADDNAFNSDRLESGGTFKQTFDKAGTYPYYCEFHGGPGGGGMAGVVKVGDGGATTAPPTPPPPTAPPAQAAPAAVTVSMKDFEFAPIEIRVKVGTTITWKNDGAKPHSATAADKSFDTAIFQPGEAKSATFSTAGTFAYFCQLHGTPDGKNGMVGTVIVEP